MKLPKDGKIILDLIGFFDENSHDLNQLYDYQIIKGHARSGGEVTLQNCREILRRTPFGSGTVHVFISSESFYVIRKDNKITDKSTYRSKVKSAVNEVPEELKQWVNDNLLFSTTNP